MRAETIHDLEPVVLRHTVDRPTGEASHLCTVDHGPRPAGPPDRCFYCGASVGTEHRKAGEIAEPSPSAARLAETTGAPLEALIARDRERGCVMRTRVIEMRAVVSIAISVPEDWDEHDVNLRYVDGTWCADNLVDWLEGFIADHADGGCLCPHVEFSYAREIS